MDDDNITERTHLKASGGIPAVLVRKVRYIYVLYLARL